MRFWYIDLEIKTRLGLKRLLELFSDEVLPAGVEQPLISDKQGKKYLGYLAPEAVGLGYALMVAIHPAKIGIGQAKIEIVRVEAELQ